MKLTHTALFVLLIVLCLGCSEKNKSFFPAPVTGDQNMVYESVLLDTIPLDLKICSFNGESGINADGNIYFLDNYYCKLFIFNTEGDSLATLLGQGQGPHETAIGRISAHAFMEDGSLALLGYALDHYWYNPDLSLRKFFFLVPNMSKDITESSKIYTHQYEDMVCRSFERNIYFSMTAEHPDFNIVSQTNEYLKKCRHISEVNMSAGEDGRMLAKGYPESYYQNKPQHLILNAICFDIDRKGNFYVGYETDSLTYVYDRDFKPLNAFGRQGKQMDTDYTPIYSIEECK
ncbi:MAG: hypothetical protein PHS48_03900, partial [Bacteroidales bacterium]|nr:hypothetical protein [Bacteroidales bacterium]